MSVTLTPKQASSALYALTADERHFRRHAEEYGWTAGAIEITEGAVVAQVAIMRQLGCSGQSICAMRRIQFGFSARKAGAA